MLYSFTIRNVGLVICFTTPNPCANPFAKNRFPGSQFPLKSKHARSGWGFEPGEFHRYAPPKLYCFLLVLSSVSSHKKCFVSLSLYHKPRACRETPLKGAGSTPREHRHAESVPADTFGVLSSRGVDAFFIFRYPRLIRCIFSANSREVCFL